MSTPDDSETAGRSGTGERAVPYACPYCAEDTLFPIEEGWHCRSCLRAFSVRFLGVRPIGDRRPAADHETVGGES
jgi:hypothetical protein